MHARLAAFAALTLTLLTGTAQAAPAAGAGGHCRFYSAAEMSALMGRKMQISIDSPWQCTYTDASNKAIRVTVRTSSHENIEMAEARKTEKVADAAGEAYYDADLFGFAARVGQHNVSVQADHRPAPRKELITIGTRITKALAGK
jgi:hypothetical protein